MPALTTNRPEVIPETLPRPGVTEKGAALETPAPGAYAKTDGRAESLMSAGREALDRNDLVAARTYFSEALRLGVPKAQQAPLRAELVRLGNETVFSPGLISGDPFVERYIIKSGDSLDKIAKANKISASLLADINGIADRNRIRAGQSIKVIKGPFHAVVEKSTFSLDVYLDTTFVKHFKVGLGADGSTPTGEWTISTKLENPTYYPPRGGQIITSDDRNNPLGERWIGLTGVSGNASGQLRYGIHGTIEPDSIGQSVSLGCIRMYNEDVEALYTYLVEKHSKVTVRD